MNPVPLSSYVAVQNDNSGPDPAVTSWDDLASVPTADVPVPLLKIWIESATGLKKITRLLTATDQTNTANGVQRPRDYDASHPKVWFEAS